MYLYFAIESFKKDQYSYFPAGHTVHEEDPNTEYVPAEQDIMSAVVLVDGQANPAGQSVQDWDEPRL